MSTSTSTRRWPILAVAGVVGLAVAATVAPVEATTGTVYLPCTSMAQEVVRKGATIHDKVLFTPIRPNYMNPYDCTVGRANEGDLVHFLQDYMRVCWHKDFAAGGIYGRADGIYGRKTRMAMKEIQQDIGVEDDGIYGAETWDGINTRKGTTNPFYQFDYLEVELLKDGRNHQVRVWCFNQEMGIYNAEWSPESGVPILGQLVG